MTLQEFINQSTNEPFLKDKHEKMIQHVKMMKITTGDQFLEHGYQKDKYYNYISGYIDATLACGKIELNESIEIWKELIEESTNYITEE